MTLKETAILMCLFVIMQLGCDDHGGGDSTVVETGTGWVSVTLGTNSGTNSTPIPKQSLAASPDDVSGSDKDGDGGVVAFATPSVFQIAVKRLTLISDDSQVNVIPDTEDLQASVLLDLTTDLVLDDMALPSGDYHTVEMELYYYQIRLPLNTADNEQMIRVYLSDDDFPEHGMGGHHQGDITFINNDGTESGWVNSAEPWLSENLLSTRGELEGAAGVDAETGHRRGLFGDRLFWDAPAFQQGAAQDIYIFADALELRVVPEETSSVKFRFETANSWFFEDFDGDNIFSPCLGGDVNGHQDACWYDATSEMGADWAPIFNPPQVSVE